MEDYYRDGTDCMICSSYAKGVENVETLVDVTWMTDAEGVRASGRQGVRRAF
jgi:hypothetical protein